MERLGVQAGQTVAGKYRLEELLGHGGMGSVWRAEHLELLSPVAVKVLKPSVAEKDTAMARFLREAKAAARLRSPHVVQILDHGLDGTVAYIAMELLDGESLLSRLRRDGRLSPELTATIITHVGRAIGRAHDGGIIHRDLKPDNVFLVPNEDEVVAKVLDFGIAKSSLVELNATGSPQTQTGALLGTPYYMSPEQAAGEKSVDHRTDLWALGVIAFECLCGRRPFQSDALGDLVLQICVKPVPVPSSTSAVPPAFDGWFAKATAREPDRRFQSAREMSAKLREALLDDAAPTRPVDRPTASLGVAEPSGSVAAAGTPSGASLPHPDPSSAASIGSRNLAPGSAALDPTLLSDEAAPSGAALTEPSAEQLAARTLDPMSATTVPRTRHVMLGATVALLALVLVAVGIIWSLGSGAPAVGSAMGGAEAADSTDDPTSPEQSASAAPGEAGAADDPAGDETERNGATTADGGPLPDAPEQVPSSAASTRASSVPHVPPRTVPPPPRRPPRTPPEEDPLGI